MLTKALLLSAVLNFNISATDFQWLNDPTGTFGEQADLRQYIYHELVDNHPEYSEDQRKLAFNAAVKCAGTAVGLHERNLDKIWACTAGFIAGANWNRLQKDNAP